MWPSEYSFSFENFFGYNNTDKIKYLFLEKAMFPFRIDVWLHGINEVIQEEYQKIFFSTWILTIFDPNCKLIFILNTYLEDSKEKSKPIISVSCMPNR